MEIIVEDLSYWFSFCLMGAFSTIVWVIYLMRKDQ